MSYYENNFIEQNNTTYNNLEEGYDNGDNFYYLTDAEQQGNGLTSLDENIYNEDTYVEHMEPARQEQVYNQTQAIAPVAVLPSVKDKKVKKTKAKLNWLYVLVIILGIALVGYYLIDNKIISFGFSGSSSTSSPSSSSLKSTLGSTFMSLH